MPAGKIYIGTSGWSNSSWKGIFYPDKMKSADFLSFYAKSFITTEINSTFYHIPRLTTVEGWVNKVPPTFRFCIKMNRYITHTKKMVDCQESLARFMETLVPAKEMLGPVLIQLPPSLKFDVDIIQPFFELLKHYPGFDFALEARHDTWLEKESVALLKKYKIVWVIAESGSRFPYAEFITAKEVYLRFHGAEKLYDSSYPDETLRAFALKIKTWTKAGYNVWIFFNNTIHDSALKNAEKLSGMLE